MPSGNVTLLEAAKSGSDVLKRGVVETVIQESPILPRLPIITIQGNAYKTREESSLPTPAFRDVNETYSQSFGTDTEYFWGTTIMGVEVRIDNYLVNVRGNLVDEKAKQYRKAAKSVALNFDYYAIKGTGAGSSFKGINQLITDGHGQEAEMATNGAALTLDKMDEAHDLLRTGTADQILMNRTVRRKITKLARDTSTGFSLIDVGDDSFGNQVMQWNGVPIAIMGDGPDGSLILDFDETQGASNVCTSMYFMRYGEDDVAGLMGAGGYFEVRDFGESDQGPYHTGRIEFYPGLIVGNKYSVVRLKGITNA